MLHSMRTRLRAMEEAEARGESFWTAGFTERVRNRVRHIITRVGGSVEREAFAIARQEVVEQEGLSSLMGMSTDAHDFETWLQMCNDEMYPTAIEGLLLGMERRDRHEFEMYGWSKGYTTELIAEINEVFAQERVAWQLVGREMVEMKSQELHTAVVEPALRLLHEPTYQAVDATYRKALDELSKGDGADAVTDAGVALEELLKALGCKGNSLGEKIKDARKKHLLGAHDTPLVEAVERAMHWVAADRSETGDSHHASDATRDDAWLVVHVVGAFIVRLAAGQPRPG